MPQGRKAPKPFNNGYKIKKTILFHVNSRINLLAIPEV